METNRGGKERKIYFDLLRMIAILCVIYNHTNRRGYFMYACTDSFFISCFYIAMASFIAVAVPIFFMISGALLLPVQESLEDLYKKRVSRMLSVILFFSLLQFAIRVAEKKAEGRLDFFMAKLFDDGVIASYWYLYAYLAYLFILPFLRKLVLVLKKEDYLYLFALLLLVEGLLPTILFFFGIHSLHDYFVIPFLNRVIVYPLLGYFMEYEVSEKSYNRVNTQRILVAMLMVIIFFVFMTKLRALPYEEFTTYDKGLYTCSFTMILDVGVYYLVKRWWQTSQKAHHTRWISLVGQTTFGIYLLEDPIRRHTSFICDYLANYMPQFLACLIWVFAIAFLAGVITFVLKKLPVFRKLL